MGASLTVLPYLPWVTFVDNGGWKDVLGQLGFDAEKFATNKGQRDSKSLRSALKRPTFIGQTWCPVVFVDVFFGYMIYLPQTIEFT